MKKKKSNKRKGALYRFKRALTGVILSGLGEQKKIDIPLNSVGLMLKSRSYEAVYTYLSRPRTQRLLKIKLLLDDKIVEISNLPKGKLDEYLEKISF